MMKSAVNALYKLHWNLDHYCPHEMFSDRERFVIEVSTGPTTSAQKQRSQRMGQRFRGKGRGSDKGPITVAKGSVTTEVKRADRLVMINALVGSLRTRLVGVIYSR
jgi:hypothetical protein